MNKISSMWKNTKQLVLFWEKGDLRKKKPILDYSEQRIGLKSLSGYLKHGESWTT